APDLPTAQSLLAELQRAQIHMNNLGLSSVVIAPADLRYPLWRFANRLLPQLVIIGQGEIPPKVQVISETTLTIAARVTPGAAGNRIRVQGRPPTRTGA
ncbi:MAG: flagellar biosynthesis component FlhA, partial [Myxococcota bacterium]